MLLSDTTRVPEETEIHGGFAAQSSLGQGRTFRHSSREATVSVMEWTGIQFGRPGSLAYRMLCVSDGKIVSPWHNIPLYNPRCLYHCVCTTPSGTWVRHRFATEDYEPLCCSVESAAHMPEAKEDGRILPQTFSKNSKWNHGLLPQTYHDPHDAHPDYPGHSGDNSPVEVIDLSSCPVPLGQVYSIKPVAAFLVTNSARKVFSWKIVAVSESDPVLQTLNSLHNVEAAFPGALWYIRQWMETREGPEGSRHVSVSEPMGADQGLTVIAQANSAWQLYTDLHVPAEPWLPPAEVMNSGLLEITWRARFIGAEGADDACVALSQSPEEERQHQQQLHQEETEKLRLRQSRSASGSKKTKDSGVAGEGDNREGRKIGLFSSLLRTRSAKVTSKDKALAAFYAERMGEGEGGIDGDVQASNERNDVSKHRPSTPDSCQDRGSAVGMRRAKTEVTRSVGLTASFAQVDDEWTHAAAALVRSDPSALQAHRSALPNLNAHQSPPSSFSSSSSSSAVAPQSLAFPPVPRRSTSNYPGGNNYNSNNQCNIKSSSSSSSSRYNLSPAVNSGGGIAYSPGGGGGGAGSMMGVQIPPVPRRLGRTQSLEAPTHLTRENIALLRDGQDDSAFPPPGMNVGMGVCLPPVSPGRKRGGRVREAGIRREAKEPSREELRRGRTPPPLRMSGVPSSAAAMPPAAPLMLAGAHGAGVPAGPGIPPTSAPRRPSRSSSRSSSTRQSRSPSPVPAGILKRMADEGAVRGRRSESGADPMKTVSMPEMPGGCKVVRSPDPRGTDGQTHTHDPTIKRSSSARYCRDDENDKQMHRSATTGRRKVSFSEEVDVVLMGEEEEEEAAVPKMDIMALKFTLQLALDGEGIALSSPRQVF